MANMNVVAEINGWRKVVSVNVSIYNRGVLVVSIDPPIDILVPANRMTKIERSKRKLVTLHITDDVINHMPVFR